MGKGNDVDHETGRHSRGMAMAERIREALEDAFEQEVRDHLREGRAAPVERLHDYLTGVADHHEPRVRLLFELLADGTLDLSGELADVPATCFFLGDIVRYQVSASGDRGRNPHSRSPPSTPMSPTSAA